MSSSAAYSPIAALAFAASQQEADRATTGGAHTPDAYLTDADRSRQRLIAAAWRAYRGELAEPFKVDPGKPNDNVRSNRCKPVVDAIGSYLFGKVVGIEVTGAKAGKPTAAQRAAGPRSPAKAKRASPQQVALDGCWGDEDDKMLLLSELRLNGAMAGQHFLKILTPDETGSRYCRLIVLDPSHVTVQTKPDDCKTAISYCIQYDDLPDPTGRGGTNMYSTRQIIKRNDPDRNAAGGYEDANSTWTIANFRAERRDAWEPDASATGGAEYLWKHPWPPIVDNPNLPSANEHWGTADLTPDFIQLNSVLNFVQSNVSRILYWHAAPWLWTDGEIQELNTSVGRVMVLPPGTTLNALSASGDIASALAFANSLRSDMDEQSHVPGVATGRLESMPRGTISGIAIEMLDGPALSLTTHLRRTYGKSIREASTRMLALCGYGDGTDANGVKVTLRWADPLPTDDAAKAQTILAYKQAEFSQHAIYDAAGLDYDVEQEYKQEEAQDDAARGGGGLSGGGDGGSPPPPNMPPPPPAPNAPPELSAAGGAAAA